MLNIVKHNTDDRLFVQMDQMSGPFDDTDTPPVFSRLSDGLGSYVVTREDLATNYSTVDDILGAIPYECTLNINVNDYSEEQLVAQYNNISQSLLRITQLGVSPFVRHASQPDDGMIKDTPNALVEARGLWRFGTCQLVTRPVEGTEELQLFMDVNLVGVLFANRFIELDKTPIEDIKVFESTYTTRPVFTELRDGGGELEHLYLDFDLFLRNAEQNEVVVDADPEEPETSTDDV